MTKTNWKILHQNKKEKLSAAEVEEILLHNRNITSSEEIKKFFSPPQPDQMSLSDFNLDKKNMAKAVDRLLKAKNTGENIVIFGDYDADGVTATAILWQFLYDNGFNVMPFIPSRFKDGYGLSPGSVDKVLSQFPKCSLTVTVDNGIVANEAAQKCRDLGIDLIITDHHQPNKELPFAESIVHSTATSGAVLAWVLIRELEKELGDLKRKSSQQLDLVAIGIVADQMSLTGINRSLLIEGLKELNKLKRPGLSALVEQAGIGGKQIGPYEIGFVIAPRINAAGRLGSALDSLRLLCVNNSTKAKEYAQKLSKTNQQRQDLVSKIVEHAKKQAEKSSELPAILIADESYHEGVIGLAASALVEEFYKPSIVFNLEGEFAKASARSINGFDIIAHIRQLEDYLIVGGGHPMAAGFTIKRDKFDEFKQKFSNIASQSINPQLFQKSKVADLELGFNSLNWDLLAAIKRFEPFGLGNYAPSFITRNVQLQDFRYVGSDNKHIKAKLGNSNKTFDSIGFNLASKFPVKNNDNRLDILYNFEQNTFRGVDNMQLKLKDVKYEKETK